MGSGGIAPHILNLGIRWRRVHRESKLKKVKLSQCLTEREAMKTYGGGGMAPHVLDLRTRWRWVISFSLQPLYPQRKSPPCPLY